MAAKRISIALTLIACGDTAWRADGRLHGRTDVPLTDAGRAAVADVLSRSNGVRIPTIHHPKDEAATETAAIAAAALGARRRVSEELADPDLGLLEGMRVQECLDRHQKRCRQWDEEPMSMDPPEGELVIDARSRIFSAVSRILKRSRAGEVAIVVHPIAHELLRSWFSNRPPGKRLWGVGDPPPSVESYIIALELLDDMRQAARAGLVAV
jgi:broad specificity phosphatase PhoE